MQIDLSSFGASDRPLLGLVQRTLILKTFIAFNRLSADDLTVLASIGHERFFAAGEVMHAPGKPVSAFHLVIDGDVQIYADGKPTRLLRGRSSIGGLAALARDPEGSHAVAVTDVMALEIEVEDMDEVFEDNFGITHGVTTVLANGLREFQMKAGGGAAVDMKKRITGVDTSRELSLVDKMFVLRSATNFAHISVEALAQMAREADELRYPAGTMVWSRGEIAEWSMLVVDGVVECIPEHQPSFRFGPSFYVGGLDAMTHSRRWYAGRAETDVVALKIHQNKWMDILEDHTDMALEMLRNLARGMVALVKLQAVAATAAEADAAAAE